MRKLPVVFLFALLAFPFAAPVLAAEQWVRIATPEFELLTTAGDKAGRETARRFEQVHDFFYKVAPVRNSGNFPLRIFQFETEAQYKPYRPEVFSIAYFSGTPAHDYIVMGDRASADYKAAIHEYVHLIVRHSGLKLPLWLNEGWADVFATLRPMGKQGNDTAVGDLYPERMKSLASDPWLDFDALTSVTGNSPTYHEASRVGIFYAESWALVHMLYLAPDYADNFPKFLAAINAGKSASEACETAFGRTPAAVFQDLHAYLDRKKIYGRVFETRFEETEANIKTTTLSVFDSRLLLADLLVAINRRDEAAAEYSFLEKEDSNRPDLNQSIGNLALWTQDLKTARRYFEKAFDAGTTDPKLCLQLAMLEDQAKEPPAKIVLILQRALNLQPDNTDTRVDLGLTQVQARDFPNAITTLMAIPKITPRRAPAVYCALAWARIHTGELEAARDDLETCRKWAKEEPDTARVVNIQKLLEARSKPAAAVLPGEKTQRVIGVAGNLECAPEGNRLQIVVGNKLISFDLPEPAAVELPNVNGVRNALTCGALKPIRIAVEFAPPRSAIETSVGIVRRLEY